MRPGDQVVLLSAPLDQGMGTVFGVNEIGWLEVEWVNGELGVYPPQSLELADRWERQQVEQATRVG